jgi:hypothetical protein
MAQRRGRLEPQPCEVCGSTNNIEKHHDDYAYPLRVRWVCRGHHSEITKRERTMPRISPPVSEAMTDTLSDWLPIADAAVRLGCSTRTVERLAAARKLEQRLRPQAGSPAVAVYNPEDVARLASERRPAPPPFVLEAVQAHGNGNGHREPAHAVSTRLIGPAGEDAIGQFFALLVRSIQSPPALPPSSPASDTVADRPAYVDKAAALAIAGVSYGELRAAVRAGEVKQRGRRYRRTDLEGL